MYNLKYWEELKTTSEIFDAYRSQRDQFISLIRKDPSRMASYLTDLQRGLPVNSGENLYLAYDRGCKYRSCVPANSFARIGTTTNQLSYQCGNCSLLDRLGCQNGRITLHQGNYIIKIIEGVTLICNYNLNNIICDNFTNRMVTTYLLSLDLNLNLLPLYIGFICGRDGLLLYDEPKRSFEVKDSTEEQKNQVIEILNRLEKLSFRVGTPLTETMFFIDQKDQVVFRVPGMFTIRFRTFELSTPQSIRLTTIGFVWAGSRSAKEILSDLKLNN